MVLSRTAMFYRTHPAARKKHVAKSAEINRRPDQRHKRVLLGRYNRLHHDPKGNMTDAIHKGDRIVGYENQSKNRGDKNDAPGDRNARGGKN